MLFHANDRKTFKLRQSINVYACISCNDADIQTILRVYPDVLNKILVQLQNTVLLQIPSPLKK